MPAALSGWVLSGCGGTDPPAATPQAKIPVAEPVKITQFYTSTPTVARGEKGLVCYGVENAKSVWISPPKREISPSMSRCIEVEPEGRTTYTLTAEGSDGTSATKKIELAREISRATAAGVRILNVNISAAEVNPGDAVSVCYKVENAQSVTVEPTAYHGGRERDGCVLDQPRKTTTYVIRAKGAAGDTDEERATIKVRAGG
jgi:hypothetical protein